MSIQRKLIKQQKCHCDGKKKKCRACNETGVYEEYHYYFIDEKNKIAFDGNTLK